MTMKSNAMKQTGEIAIVITTERQKKAVEFCEYWLNVEFKGNLDNRIDVSRFLSEHLDRAKFVAEEATYNMDIY